MSRKIAAIVAVYLVVAFAWVALGGSIMVRTWSADGKLKEQVSALWGDRQVQSSPELEFHWIEKVKDVEEVEDRATGKKSLVTKEREVAHDVPVLLESTKVDVDLHLDQRRKGLLWYATYGVGFRGRYAYTHEDDRDGTLVITYRFPTTQANYSDYRFAVDGAVDPKVTPVSENGVKIVRQVVPVRRGSRVAFDIGYRSRGLDWWRYSFGSDVNRVKNFDLTMKTDFKAIDFPAGTISPDLKEERPDGWTLHWRSENLISGFQIGMEMPRRLNPGPLASEIAYFAPVSLGFFFMWMFVITLMKRIDLHPMNYLFLGAAFFAFHLLFAYTVDKIDLVAAFVLASAVSVFLVVSYLRLVVGLRFAAVEAGISQFVYLVLFSYAHFFEGSTGLIVTIGSIVTLFLLMQLTGRIKWEEKFARRPAAGGPLPLNG